MSKLLNGYLGEIKAIVNDIREEPLESLQLKSNLRDDLGIDSMMALELMADIEKAYSMHITESELKSLSDVESLIELIERHKVKKNNA